MKYSIYLSKYQCKDILKVVNQELIDYYKKNEVDMIDIQQSKLFDKRNKQMKKQLNKKDSIEGQIETKPKTEENITEVKENVSCEIESLQTQRKIIEQEIELLKKKENELNKCKTKSHTKPETEQKHDQQFNNEPQMKVKFCMSKVAKQSWNNLMRNIDKNIDDKFTISTYNSLIKSFTENPIF